MTQTDMDPGLRQLLDQLAAAGGAGVDSMSPAEAREMFVLMSALQGEREDVGSVEEGEVAGVPVRTYLPAGGSAAGTLAWFHGGGWVIGDLETTDSTARKLANRSGCRVVSVGYRLAPEHPFPAPLDDCWAVTETLAAEGGPLAVGGDSAGGNLAAVVARRARDRAIELRHQLLLYPVTDLASEAASYAENGEGNLLTAAGMRWFIAHYVPDAASRRDPDASPLLAGDLAGVAPAHVITAGFDVLRDEGDAYAERLAASGVPVVHDRLPDMIHGFIGMGAVTTTADDVLSRAGEILAHAMMLEPA